MLVKFYLLGAALALMPLPIQPQEPYSQNLFHYVPLNIDKSVFPINFEVATNSDMVLVKCPGAGYRHKNDEDVFMNSNDVLKYKNFVPLNTSLFVWVPLLKKSSNSAQLNCGKIFIKSGENPWVHISWTYNVKWINSMSKNIKINLNNMDHPLPETPDECHDATGNLLIMSEDRENDTVVAVNPRNVKNPYANQLFYYFIKPEQNDERKIIEPCSIYRGFKDLPTINLPDYEVTYLSDKVAKVKENVLNKVYYIGSQEIKIKVNLKLNNDTQFYRCEEISLSKMRYTKNGLIDIKDSTIKINSSFFINVFDLVKLVYNHLDTTGDKEVSQIYYFGPALKNFTYGVDYIRYIHPSEGPNCAVNFMNVGYLEKVVYNGIEGNIDTLHSTDGIKGKFKKNLDFIFFEETNGCKINSKCKTYIRCIYKTLDGTITMPYIFDYSNRIVG
uniref:ZP domain-containing protein n=1 Tax=Strongyloides papillosus TaxID=174720 RepID=A0A0N5C0D3_STREA